MTRSPFLQRLSKFWAARSLMVGGASVALDLTAGTLVLLFGGPTRAAAMTGTTLGSLWTYFANRHFSFKDHQENVPKSGLKFLLMSVVLNTAHGQAVVWLRDGFGVPYVPAKILADLMVVTVPQLLIMRYFVFPKAKRPPASL